MGAGDSAHAGAAPAANRKAIAVDEAVKAETLRRLKRIEGQVRGLQRMVAEERYCADILVQMSSVHEALRAAARALLGNHLRHCAAKAIRSEDAAEAETMYQELVDLFAKYSR